MQNSPFRLNRVPGLLAAGLVMAVATLNSAQAADAAMDRGAERAQHRQEWVRAKLDRDANRLEIKASQQAAWQEYAKARTALAERHFTKPAQDLDAAAIAKNRADRVAESARKLAVLADATAKLQVVLSPEQRQTLSQMAHHGHHGHHGHGHRGWQGGPDGHRGAGEHGMGPRGDGHAADDADQNREEPAA